MDWRLLKHFIAVVDEGSISAAAVQVGVTQSALSRQVKALEEDLGVSLLERQAHSITPTAAGQLLAADGRRLLQASQQLIQRVRAQAQGKVIEVGYSPSLASGLLSEAMKQMRERQVAARLLLRDESSRNMRRLLGKGELDLVITAAQPEQETAGQWRLLCELPWRLAVSRAHPLLTEAKLEQREKISLSQLSGQALLIFEREHYPDYWAQVSGWLARHQLAMSLGGEYDGVESLSAALEAGLGVALVAESTRLRAEAELELVEIESPPEPTQVCVGLAAGREEQPEISEFLDCLEQLTRA